MSKEPKPKQTTLADLVTPGGIDWTDARIGLHLIPDLPGPEPSADMVESVRVVGILSPVILVDRPEGYDVRAGRRRIKAARLAGLLDVPARIAPAAAVDLAGAAAVTLIENAQRSANPLAEFDAIQSLIERGMTESEIAHSTGIAVGTIRKRARLRTLVPTLAAAFRSGEISAAVAEDLARLPATHQNGFARRIGTGEPITRKDVAASRRKRTGKAIAALDPAIFSGPGLDRPVDAPAAGDPDGGRIEMITPGLAGMAEMFGPPPGSVAAALDLDPIEIARLPRSSVAAAQDALQAIFNLANLERGDTWDATITQIRQLADDAMDYLG